MIIHRLEILVITCPIECLSIALDAIRARRVQARIASYSNGGFDKVDPAFAWMVEQIIQLANDRGQRPYLVITTMHPDCIRLCGPAGWNARRAEVLRALEGMRARHDFTVLDFSDPVSWGGDGGAFLDEIHVRQSAADDTVRSLATRPDVFGREAPQCAVYRTLKRFAMRASG